MSRIYLKRKTLFVLCLPLICVVVWDAWLLLDRKSAGPTGKANADILGDLKQRLNKSRETGKQFVPVVIDLCADLLGHHQQRAKPISLPPSLDSAVAKAHGRWKMVRQDTAKFVEVCIDGQTDGSFEDVDGGRLYRGYLQSLREAREIEAKLRAMLTPPGSYDSFYDAVERYMKNPWRNRTFVERHIFEFEKNTLLTKSQRDVNKLLDESIKSGIKREKTIKDVEELVREFDAFLRRFGRGKSNSENLHSIEKEYKRWKHIQVLLLAADKDFKLPSNDVKLRLAMYKNLTQELLEYSETSRFVAKIAEHLCASYLPQMLPLENVVILHDLNGNAVQVPRNQVAIVWKTDMTKSQPLNDPELKYNEFTLKNVEDDIAYYLVDGSRPRQKPIKGTASSQAAHEYNTRRGNLQWTLPSLKKFREECQQYRQALGDNWQRIEDVYEAMSSFPEFFSSGR